MLKMVQKLFSMLAPHQRKQFYVLQILVVLMSFTELLGIASIAPFMALVGDISLLEQGGLFTQLYQFSGLTNPTDFLFYTGLFVLVMLILSSVISMYTIWRLSMYGTRVGTELADRLYAHYLQQDWLFHAGTSSALLTKQISVEALRVTDTIIQPLLIMNAKLVLTIFILIGMFVYNPLLALSGIVLFAGAYILLYKIVRKRLQDNGNNMSQIFTKRFRLMNEGFGGIKDVLLLNRRHGFVERFQESGKNFAYARGANNAISQVPRYFMELIAFGSMIGLVLVLIKLHQGNLGAMLPVLALYALAAFKLLPAIQQLYVGIAQIKGNAAAFEAIEDDLTESLKSQSNGDQQQIATESTAIHLPLRHKISLNNITFSYPGKLCPALNGFNMIIPANSTVGLVGASGSGKSTAIDLLLGLLPLKQGELCIDDIRINAENKRAWQNTIGFVPQSIFLSEGSIAENVAFGLPVKNIDLEQVKKAIQLAHLTEMVELLPNGLETRIGERGVQLSGGQRQRIGIARALYNEADVLVFDEATSALDGITEKIIMEAIHDFTGQKTIIMIAHRLKTVQKCDIIYLMEQGQITAQGSYSELVKKDDHFREMAEHS
jgi:ATP-binding cassette, subfamily B, bacterial PglK